MGVAVPLAKQNVGKNAVAWFLPFGVQLCKTKKIYCGFPLNETINIFRIPRSIYIWKVVLNAL